MAGAKLLLIEAAPINAIEISATAIDEWPPLNQSGLYQKVDGGFPLVVFSEAMDSAIVLSPASTFMSAAQSNFKDPQTGDTTLTFGPLGSIVEVFKCYDIIENLVHNSYA